MCFIFSYVFLLLISILNFSLKKSFQGFLQDRFEVRNSLMFSLFIWVNIYLPFISEGQLCCIKYSWLAVLSFSNFKKSFTLSWPESFLMRNLLIVLWEFPCIWGIFYFLLTLKFSSSLVLDNFVVIYLGEDHFELKIWGNL